MTKEHVVYNWSFCRYKDKIVQNLDFDIVHTVSDYVVGLLIKCTDLG